MRQIETALCVMHTAGLGEGPDIAFAQDGMKPGLPCRKIRHVL